MTKRSVSDKSNLPFDPAAKKARLEARATEGAKGMADYRAEGEAERAKTAQLKAQRLAKVATDKKCSTTRCLAYPLHVNCNETPDS